MGGKQELGSRLDGHGIWAKLEGTYFERCWNFESLVKGNCMQVPSEEINQIVALRTNKVRGWRWRNSGSQLSVMDCALITSWFGYVP